jgi:Domain of unknown function (DUF4349)
VSRDEMTAAARAELDALDRIVAQEHVGEEHLELAALVDSVRGGAPRMDPAYRARLDESIAARLARPRRRGFLRRPAGRPRLAAIGGGGLVTAAVAFVIVISSGLLHGASNNGTTTARKHAASAQRALGPAKIPTFGAAASTPPAPGAIAHAETNTLPSRTPSGRLVRRHSELVLASAPASMQHVANEIVARTEQRGGVVASSNVSTTGAGGGATFSLQIPSARLGSLIGALSSLASVRALSQATTDITSNYNGIAARLADHRARATALRTALASAATTASDQIQRQLDAVERRIALEVRALATLHGQATTATLGVVVVPATVAHHHSGAAGPLASSFHNALGVLVEMLAVALVVLAIALPVALTALGVAWSTAALRQRSRERAIRTA